VVSPLKGLKVETHYGQPAEAGFGSDSRGLEPSAAWKHDSQTAKTDGAAFAAFAEFYEDLLGFRSVSSVFSVWSLCLCRCCCVCPTTTTTQKMCTAGNPPFPASAALSYTDTAYQQGHQT
jgi:hypothetical protein